MDAQAYNQVLHGVYSTGIKNCAHWQTFAQSITAYVGKLHRIVVTGVLVGAKIHYMHVLHAYVFQAKLTYENRVQYRGPVYCPSG